MVKETKNQKSKDIELDRDRRELEILRESLKAEQENSSMLKEDIAKLELGLNLKIEKLKSDNRLLRYRLRDSSIVELLKLVFSSIFGTGLGLFFVPEIPFWFALVVLFSSAGLYYAANLINRNEK